MSWKDVPTPEEKLVSAIERLDTLLSGPPADATCGTCRWRMGKYHVCYVDAVGYRNGGRDGKQIEEYQVEEDDPACRHWRSK